jgi:hypothetical protein
MILFSKIEDIFRVTGYGFFVVPGAIAAGACLKARDLIQLGPPDGRTLNTQVAAVEFMKGARVKRSIALRPASDVKEPLGTEIWLARDE